MRRLVIFLLILTIPIGFLTGATKTIGGLQDDVEITPIHIYGDPARVEGIRLEMMTTMNEHIWWTTDYTAGETGTSDTTFHFSQEERTHEISAPYWDDFAFYSSSGVGMSMGGGEGFVFDESNGIGAIAKALADKAQPGEIITEEVLLENYTDVYPMSYQVSIHVGNYWLERNYDGVTPAFDPYETAEMEDYRRWMELFRFPVQPGQKVEMTITKDMDGKVRDIKYDLWDAPRIEFITYVTMEGMYFTPKFVDVDGKVLTTGEYPEGYGLYYIPFKFADNIDPALVGEDEICSSEFDFDNLELVYGLDDTDQILATESDEAGARLHMLAMDDGVYTYCALDLVTGQIVSQVEIMPDESQERGSYSHEFFPEQELLYLWHNSKVALVDISWTPKVEFISNWPEGIHANPPESILYRDGVLYMTDLNWYDGAQVFSLSACDENGLDYFGYCRSNLQEPEETTSGGNYISLDRVAFAQ